jgi:DNA-binding response OmpR family regulator
MANATIHMLSLDDKTVTTHLDRAGYRQMGVQVKSVSSYDEARRALLENEIHIIVINADYPKLNPVTVVSSLKGDAETKDIPIIATSVRSDVQLQKKLVQAGIALFVEQPVPRETFIKRIRQILDQSTRNDDRVDMAGLTVKVVAGKDRSFECEIADVSGTGMLLSTEQKLEAGDQVELDFLLPDFKKPLKIRGTVVRHVDIHVKSGGKSRGVGVRFEEYQGDAQKRLERYLAKSNNRDLKMAYYL